MADDDEDNGNKVIFLGESNVGKTNLIKISIGKKFEAHSLTTWSASYVPKEIDYNNQKYTFNLWDTIGQEKYRSLTKIFLKDAKIVILVYDITKRESFDSLPFWKKIIDEILGPDPIFGVVGNKIDLYYDEKVKEEEGEEYANSIGAKFLLTSAKNDSKGFGKFIEQLFFDYIENNNDESQRIESVIINRISKKKNKRCC